MNLVPDPHKMFEEMAEKLRRSGELLSCGGCGRAGRPSKRDIIAYLKNGWPKCCGLTMRWSKAASPGAGAAGRGADLADPGAGGAGA